MGWRSIFALLLYKLAPVNPSRYVFTSYNGHYSDSPKYICDAIHSMIPDAEYIWITERKYAPNLPSWAKWVNINSFQAEWMKGSAKVRVDNVFCGGEYTISKKDKCNYFKGNLLCRIRNKRGQFAYSAWHGTPLKRMGRDQVGSDVEDFLCAPLTIFVGNQFTEQIMRRITFCHTTIVNLGMPRNDLLFKEDIRNDIKKRLNLPIDKKLLLFAPTFRDNEVGKGDKHIRRSGLDQLEQMVFPVLFDTLTEKFGGDWALICRFHYHVAQMVNWNELEKKYPGRIINGNEFDEMSEYLVCADALLSDASSCIFDFSLMRRPVFLFFPDVLQYENHERGFYIPFSELPFSMAKSFEELINNIQAFDEETYRRDISNMLKKMDNVDDGYASNRIAEYITRDSGLKLNIINT